MRAEFCIFESNAPGLKANFYEPSVDMPSCSLTNLQLYIHVHENSEVRNDSDVGSRKQAPQNSLVLDDEGLSLRTITR